MSNSMSLDDADTDQTQVKSTAPPSGNSGSMLRFFLTQFPVLRRVSKAMDRRFTTRGKMLLICSFFAVVGSIHLDSPVYLLAGASLSLILTSFLAARAFRPNLSIESHENRLLFAGQTGHQKILLKNESNLAASWLTLETRGGDLSLDANHHGSSTTDIPAGELASIAFPLRADRRGAYEMPEIRIRSSFPFQLVFGVCTAKPNRPQPNTNLIHVAPRVISIDVASDVAALVGRAIGEQFCHRSASGSEPWDAREYTPGMATNRWHFAAWARTGVPHVRQYESLGEPVGCIFLDLETPAKHGQFERKLELAWSILLQLVAQPVRIGSVAWQGTQIEIDGLSFDEIVWRVGCELATLEPIESNTIDWRSQGFDFLILVSDDGNFRERSAHNHPASPVISFVKLDLAKESHHPINFIGMSQGQLEAQS